MLILTLILLQVLEISCINSYIYLPDKLIQEELPIGTVVIELSDELNKYYYTNSQFQAPTSPFQDQQFAFLDDVQTRFASSTYFLLDPVTGRVTTKRYIDRESMCLNRHCMDVCVEANPAAAASGNHTLFQCKLNLKVLLQPSSNILSVNVVVDDINDNRPQFRKEFFNTSIPENVPVGYRIPIELAYDPDVGRNTIQYYELVEFNTQLDVIKETFELKQNLNEMQLALIVKKKLDRELQSFYSFAIVAHDGGIPSYSGRLDCLVQIQDINDNNPQFGKEVFKFTISEDTPVSTQIGYIHATDLDEGLNGKIKYSLVGSIINGNPSATANMHNYASYFDIDLYSGLLTLKKQLDYEDEPFFGLTVEARDSGIGSLPAYAIIEIHLIDTNDNAPEISVSFLNNLRRKVSNDNEGAVVIYLNENTEPNKFIAHVSITDKDSNENKLVSWHVELNGQPLLPADNSNYMKLALLNNDSFTINTGKKQLDREEIERLNVAIFASDHGDGHSNNASYRFQIELADENDNKPKFASNTLNLTIFENNKLNEVIARINATDADAGENSRLTFKLKDTSNRLDEKFFSIDPQSGVLKAKRIFDREQRSHYRFYVIATDNGTKQQHSGNVFVNIKILDVNDHSPQIYFDRNETGYFESLIESNNTIVLSVNENLPYNTQLIQFRANDSDIDENAAVRYFIAEPAQHPFRLNEHTGQLNVIKRLDREQSSVYNLQIVCENTADGYTNSKFQSTVNVLIRVTDVNDNCPYGINLTERRFLDASSMINNSVATSLFRLKYTDLDDSLNSMLHFTLLSYKSLFELKVVHDESANFYRVDILFRINVIPAKLKLGKYIIKLQINDYGDPKCVMVNHFQLYVGNKKLYNYVLLNEALKSLKENTQEQEQLDFQYDQINYDYDYNGSMREFFSTIDDYSNLLENENTTSQLKADTSTRTANDTLRLADKIRTFKLDFINYDHVLVFIMILIIVLIAILISLLGTIYFYKKYNQLRIKKLLKNANNTSTTSNSSAENDFDKLKYEQQQYYIEKQKQKKRSQSYAVTNNASNLTPDSYYSTNNLSLSIHSTNDESVASSVLTKETKLNNLSVTNESRQLGSASSSSSSANENIMKISLPYGTIKSYNGTTYTHPLTVTNADDAMIILEHNRNSGLRQVALPISTINSECYFTGQQKQSPEMLYAKTKTQKEKQINFMNAKLASFNGNDDVFEVDDDDEYNEKFSFLNEYKNPKAQNNQYKNSDV